MGALLSLFKNDEPPPMEKNVSSNSREEQPVALDSEKVPFKNVSNTHQEVKKPSTLSYADKVRLGKSQTVTNNRKYNVNLRKRSYSGQVPSSSGPTLPETTENKFYKLCIQEYKCSSEVDFVKILKDTPEYIEIKENFSKYFKHEKPNIIKIEKVRNCCLMSQYILKKEEYNYKNIVAKEHYYYHGTKIENLHSICRDNFNWRITKHNRFGKGVSFAPSSFYANNYCDQNPNKPKIMFVVRVLLGKACKGYEDMPLPRNGFDATKKFDEQVIVKFYDNEFYPEYLIHFTGCIIDRNIHY